MTALTSLSKQQFGIMDNRGTADAMFIVRKITQKANEHQVPMHLNSVDFEAAFDTDIFLSGEGHYGRWVQYYITD